MVLLPQHPGEWMAAHPGAVVDLKVVGIPGPSMGGLQVEAQIVVVGDVKRLGQDAEVMGPHPPGSCVRPAPKDNHGGVATYQLRCTAITSSTSAVATKQKVPGKSGPFLLRPSFVFVSMMFGTQNLARPLAGLRTQI